MHTPLCSSQITNPSLETIEATSFKDSDVAFDGIEKSSTTSFGGGQTSTSRDYDKLETDDIPHLVPLSSALTRIDGARLPPQEESPLSVPFSPEEDSSGCCASYNGRKYYNPEEIHHANLLSELSRAGMNRPFIQ